MGECRTSRKQVEKILNCLTYEENGYQLIAHDFCGRYKYSICRYSRKPNYVDHWGRVITWTEWKYEETLISFVSLKKAYEYTRVMLEESLKETQEDN